MTMLFKLSTTVCHPSAVGKIVAFAGDLSSQNALSGELAGAWTVDIGALCRLIELRTLAREDVAHKTPELTDHHPDIRAVVTSISTTLLEEVLPFQSVSGTDHVYEWRRYRTRAGFIDEWLKLFVAVMPARERYSARVGLWRTLGGAADEVSQLWVYDDLKQRAVVRAKVMRDPAWQSLLKVAPEMLSEMHSMILLPTPYSPLR
jgi:hypothetical protein